MIRHRTWRMIMLLVAIGCMILALSCGLSTFAVRAGVIAPPDINLDIGSIRVVGLTSRMPDCHRLLAPGCARLSETSAQRFYTLWLLMQREQNSWDRPTVTQLISMRLQS